MNERQADVLKTAAAALAARERLHGTVAALQSRLDRRTIARRTQKRLSNIGSDVVGSARANPAAAGGVTVIGVLLLLRRLRRRKVAATPATLPPRDRA